MRCPECKIKGKKIGQHSYACPKCGKKIEDIKPLPKKDKKK